MDSECKLMVYAGPTSAPPSDVQVEAGFYAVLYNGLLESSKDELQSLKGTLTVTGHSLGSALARAGAQKHLTFAKSLAFPGPRHRSTHPALDRQQEINGC